MNKGKLFIISGPSGVGKSTLRENLLKDFDNFWYSISMTTRKPRVHEKTKKLEQNGVDYFFVSKDEFIDNIKKNNFLEYAEVYKDIYYGTPKDKVLEKLNNGINVILEIDVDGKEIVKKNYNDCISIFIKPKSLSELENRLLKRKSETYDKIKTRLERAEYEISKSSTYDYVIVSNTKEEDYDNFSKLIKKLINK